MRIYHEDSNHYFYFDNCELTKDLDDKELVKLAQPILRLFVALNAVNAMWYETDEWDSIKYNFTGARSNVYELKNSVTENLEFIALNRSNIIADANFTEFIESNARLPEFRQHFDYMSMVIDHEILYYTFVNFRPDTINSIYAILMPGIIYTVFREILNIRKGLNLKEIDPKTVKIVDAALGTLRYAFRYPAGILDYETIKGWGWGYYSLTNNKDVYKKYKVYATHVINSTMEETLKDPILL